MKWIKGSEEKKPIGNVHLNIDGGKDVAYFEDGKWWFANDTPIPESYIVYIEWLDESQTAPVQEGKSAEERDRQAEEYAFQIPYHGSNNFYNDTKLKSFIDGWNAAMAHYRNQSTGLREGEKENAISLLQGALPYIDELLEQRHIDTLCKYIDSYLKSNHK